MSSLFRCYGDLVLKDLLKQPLHDNWHTQQNLRDWVLAVLVNGREMLRDETFPSVWGIGLRTETEDLGGNVFIYVWQLLIWKRHLF